MAKKYEFKPDKPRSSWLSKLHLTVLQRKAILKWGLFGLSLLVLSVLQDVILCRFRFYGATTELVPCAIILICVIMGTERGGVFVLISSALYLFSGTAPGPYSMVFLTFWGLFVSILRQAFLQKGFFATMLCTALAMVAYVLCNFIIGVFLGLAPFDRFFGACITAGLSLISAPILYPIFMSIGSIGGEAWKE